MHKNKKNMREESGPCINHEKITTTPPSQIISYYKNLGELKYLKFNQNYRKNYKDLWHQIDIL
jgi:hypothetical protein